MRWLEGTPIGKAVAYFRNQDASATGDAIGEGHNVSNGHDVGDWNGHAEGEGHLEGESHLEREGTGHETDAPPPWGDGRSRWTKEGQNPFLKQRHEFHNRLYDLVRAKRNWQIVAFLALAALLVVTVGYVQMASSSRITPYVVEVDALGQARAFGPAERMPISQMDRAVTAELAEFITNARRVIADVSAQREAIVEAYAFVDQKAQTFLNHFYSQEQNDPRFLSQRVRRKISIESILKMPESDSYKVRWTEREIGLNSSTALRTSWEAILAVKMEPPETEAGVLVNPLGLRIYDINWSKIHTIEEELQSRQ